MKSDHHMVGAGPCSWLIKVRAKVRVSVRTLGPGFRVKVRVSVRVIGFGLVRVRFRLRVRFRVRVEIKVSDGATVEPPASSAAAWRRRR